MPGLPVASNSFQSMNVWALNKNNAIRRVLLALAGRFGTDAFVLSQRWDADAGAVGIFRPGEESLLAYIFTHGQETGKYGLHLEYPGSDAMNASAQTVENISLNPLLELLDAHFDNLGPALDPPGPSQPETNVL